MNIKKLLKSGAKDVLPDEKIKEDIKQRVGIEGDEREAELGGIKAKIKNNKKLVAAAACVLAAAIIVCAFIPLMPGGNSSTNPNNPGNIGFGELSSAEEVYGFSAATAGMVISGMDDAVAAAANAVTRAKTAVATGKSEKSANKTDGGQIDDEQTIAKLNDYMELVEGLISGNNFTVEGGKNPQEKYSQYEYVMRVSYTDMLGQQRDSGTIYYNRTHESTERDDDESETTYSLEGVMVLGGEEYRLSGTHVSESEEGDSENEYEMFVYLDDGYILVEQSVESEEGENEIEYSYTLFSKGVQVSRTTFEYEQENGGETELIMTVKESGKQPEIFAFENEDGEITIHLGGAAGDVVYNVKIIGGQYVYFRGGRETGRGDRD
ncbi:MAG TPA: hypothetical protein IAB25_06025 [Candidatus Coproplasma stercoravium]|nr:hypothetical protein [Candidatus Coproplasma stercoravium]